MKAPKTTQSEPGAEGETLGRAERCKANERVEGCARRQFPYLLSSIFRIVAF